MGGRGSEFSSGSGLLSKSFRASGNEITQGSEKQINWAKSIRDDLVNTININLELINERERKYGLYPDADEKRLAYRIYADSFKEQSKDKSASWYIDNRGRLSPEAAIRAVDGRVMLINAEKQKTGKTLKQLLKERKKRKNKPA